MARTTGSRALVVSVLLMLTAQPLLAADVGDVADCDAIHAFAEFLQGEGDYYRSVTEYKRLLFQCDSDTLAQRAVLGVADCYFLAGRYRDAVEWCRSENAGAAPGSHLPVVSGHALFRLGDYEDAVTEFAAVADTCHSGLECSQALYLSGLSLVRLERPGEAESYLLRVEEASPYRARAQVYASQIHGGAPYPTKNSRVAGVLGIVPGLGYAYCEHYGTAVASLAVNVLLAWATVDAFDDGNNAAGFTYSIFSVGFYLGNVVGSVQSAHRYNEYQSHIYHSQFPE